MPDEASAPFWEAAADGVLVLPAARAASRSPTRPTPVCPHCHHTDPRVRVRAGRAVAASIRSWTVVRQSFLPGFDDDLPFVLVDVALDGRSDDLRLIGRLLDGPDAPLARRRPRSTVAFEDLDDGVAVPAFALATP